MKKIVSLAIVAGMMLAAVSVHAESKMIKMEFEEGISGFGISYSGRVNNYLPSIFSSTKESFSGNASLEMVPTKKLPYSNGTAYQGVYCGEYLQTEKGNLYSVSANVMTKADSVAMRWIQMDENEVASVSKEYTLSPSVWLNAEYQFEAAKTSKKNKMILAFYSTSTSSGDESIYVDDFIMRSSYMDAKNWKSSTGKVVVDGGTITFTDAGANFSAGTELTCEVKNPMLSTVGSYLSGTLISDMDDAYVAVSCDELPGIYEEYAIRAGEETTISLGADSAQFNSDKLTLRIKVYGNAKTEGKIVLKKFDILGDDYVPAIRPQGNKIVVSGRLKNGNEGNNITVKTSVGEQTLESVSCLTDAYGYYTSTVIVPDAVDYGKIEVILEGINGYPEDTIKGQSYYVSNHYRDEIAGKVQLCKNVSEVEAVLTEETLNQLGLFKNPIFRGADLSVLAKNIFESGVSGLTYKELEKALITWATILTAENTGSGIYEMIGRYEQYLIEESNNVYHDLFDKTDAKRFDGIYAEFVTEANTLKALNKKTAWTLVKSEVLKANNYSEAMTVVKKYAGFLGLDLTKYTQIANSSAGYTAANQFISYLKTEVDYSKAQATLEKLCNGDGSSGGGTVGGGGGVSTPGVAPGIVDIVPQQSDIIEADSYKFTDLGAVSWAQDSIYRLTDKGIISRNEENKFYPQDKVTRAEFVKMVAVMLGYTRYSGEEVFTDVTKEDWYFDYVMALYERGIIKGISEERFGANEFISRQDICVILSRVLSMTESTEERFSDHAEIAPYAVEAVYQMKQAGYVNGYEDYSFRPEGSTTRAEAAKILDNVMDRN